MRSENRKVKNAVEVKDGDIVFRSILESRIYNKLIELGIQPEYEPDKITLIKGFKPKHQWFIDGKLQKSKIRDLTYTPDFLFRYKGVTVYLEVKGFITDRYPLKRKMFLKYLESEFSNTVFAEVKSIQGLKRTLEQIDNILKQPVCQEQM